MCGIYGGNNFIATSFSLTTSCFPQVFHFASALCSFILGVDSGAFKADSNIAFRAHAMPQRV